MCGAIAFATDRLKIASASFVSGYRTVSRSQELKMRPAAFAAAGCGRAVGTLIS
jgi:hypothetical protein